MLRLQEVRGITTRAVVYYDGNEKLFGFEFTNENNYDVWIDVELCTHGFGLGNSHVVSGVRYTKSITLKSGESYILKCDKYMRFDGKTYSEKFYVTYKAYKVN